MALERSVAAALSKAACREDVGWTSEYTAWMDGSLKTVQYSAVLENRQFFFLINTDVNYMRFPINLKGLLSCFSTLTVDVK